MAPHTTREIITRDGESESVRETSVGWKVVCGGAAGTVAGVVTYPNDTVRRRLQLQGGSSNEILYKNALDCWKTMWKKEGIASYFRGMSANLIRVVPNHAIQFGMYGLFVDIFAKYH